MGNAVGSGVSGPHSPPPALRLRRGKRITGCPCFLSEQASTWEAVTLHDKFRAYVLRHLLDEAFICSILEHGEREHALGACEGVLYYKVCRFHLTPLTFKIVILAVLLRIIRVHEIILLGHARPVVECR